MTIDDPIEVLYTNHKGETRVREIVPQMLKFGATEYHPEPQWLLEVFDTEKQAPRTYALAACDFRV